MQEQGLRNRIAYSFDNMTPANKTPTLDGLLGAIQSGLVSGSEMLDNYKIQGQIITSMLSFIPDTVGILQTMIQF